MGWPLDHFVAAVLDHELESACQVVRDDGSPARLVDVEPDSGVKRQLRQLVPGDVGVIAFLASFCAPARCSGQFVVGRHFVH